MNTTQKVTRSSQDFESENLRKYTAIKIHGSDAIMDIWAQKFLLMKPVEPPNGE